MILYDGLNNLTWFIGLIEDLGDPTNNGRVKIRAFGFHPTVEENTVDTADLPWALVLGVSPHMHVPLDRGELVFGAFLDGRDAQIPLVFGTIPTPKFGIPVTAGKGGGAADSGQVGSSGISGYTQGPAPVPSTDAAKEAFDYFVSQGWTPEQAAGIVGNLQVESGANIDPTAVGDNGQAYGIAQWHPDRQANFESVFGIPIQQSTYEQQLQFVNYELTQGEEQAAGRALSSAQTAEEAAFIVDDKYERSSGAALDQRQSNAGNIYGSYAGLTSGPAGMPPTNLMLKNSPEVIDNFGNKALPPQSTGEDIHKTPVAAATNNSKNYNSNGYSLTHPGVPVGGSYKTGVWNARYDGSYIEMHAGASKNDEHINLMHRSGSHITLDQNGNITISSVGRVHISSTNNLEEHIDGYTTNVSKGGYSIFVDGGSLNLASSGDINITSNSNINFGAGGNIWMTAGGAAGISAPKIGMTAEAGIISMLAGQNIAMQSTGDITSKATNMVLNSSGKLGIKTDGDLTVKGDNLVIDAGGNLGVQSAGDLTVKGDTLSLASSGDLKQKGGSGIILDGGWVGIKSNSTTTVDAGGIAYIKGSEIHLNDGGSVGSVSAPEIEVPDIIAIPDTGGAVKPEGPAGSPPPMGVGAGKSAKTNAPKPGGISITDIDDVGAQ